MPDAQVLRLLEARPEALTEFKSRNGETKSEYSGEQRLRAFVFASHHLTDVEVLSNIQEINRVFLVHAL